jgi:hypothetical protein
MTSPRARTASHPLFPPKAPAVSLARPQATQISGRRGRGQHAGSQPSSSPAGLRRGRGYRLGAGGLSSPISCGRGEAACLRRRRPRVGVASKAPGRARRQVARRAFAEGGQPYGRGRTPVLPGQADADLRERVLRRCLGRERSKGWKTPAVGRLDCLACGDGQCCVEREDVREQRETGQLRALSKVGAKVARGSRYREKGGKILHGGSDEPGARTSPLCATLAWRAATAAPSTWAATTGSSTTAAALLAGPAG